MILPCSKTTPTWPGFIQGGIKILVYNILSHVLYQSSLPTPSHYTSSSTLRNQPRQGIHTDAPDTPIKPFPWSNQTGLRNMSRELPAWVQPSGEPDWSRRNYPWDKPRARLPIQRLTRLDNTHPSELVLSPRTSSAAESQLPDLLSAAGNRVLLASDAVRSLAQQIPTGPESSREDERRARICKDCPVPVEGQNHRCPDCKKKRIISSQRQLLNRRKQEGKCGACGKLASPKRTNWRYCDHCCGVRKRRTADSRARKKNNISEQGMHKTGCRVARYAQLQ